jgi:hypothetical protein
LAISPMKNPRRVRGFFSSGFVPTVPQKLSRRHIFGRF